MKEDVEAMDIEQILALAEQAIEAWDLERVNPKHYRSTPFTEVAEYRYFLQMMGTEAPWESVDACDRMLLRLEQLQANPWTRNTRGYCARTFLDAIESLMREQGWTPRYMRMSRVKEVEVQSG
jgi:hypothetical protein